MISWYQAFTLAVALIWLLATERDRAAARIVLIATVGSSVLVHCVTHYIVGAWKLVFPGALETLTILSLFQWARNRTGYTQVACLVVAWLAHVICYIDIKCGTDLVYSRYETILAAVAVAQLAAFHDTVRHIVGGMVAWAYSLRAYRLGSLRHASECDPVLRDSRLP